MTVRSKYYLLRLPRTSNSSEYSIVNRIPLGLGVALLNKSYRMIAYLSTEEDHKLTSQIRWDHVVIRVFLF
jgi:hypothetical protein